ncbi:YggS family pyridoxal phosphate-dependent enzyme [Planococcus lenghuensis]|uniref:Pyridoxal phosphate homeostasis protein n=1 Tax=Planococcus lenghuensis TaxID=2213202 RepID=A0A1Q2L047_9BACL|nr:YggS family pyridoxal phosphate-dependent enzyme [Planococcus lenghuensis]AQQ53793.1 YggS family pyridoxal phosphate enzyme [Planococcus lenghuensis]
MEPVKPIFDRLTEELSNIRSGINVVAVTKNVSTVRTQEAIDAGIVHIGENRAEGLIEKRKQINAEVTWHFIGSLQSRKVKDVIHLIDYLHSLDRKSLAKEIQKRAETPVNCFVQVNISGEESKHGLTPENTLEFILSLAPYDKIRVVGLMTMAPHTNDTENIRATFAGLKKLQAEIAAEALDHAPCTECSMGMSNDYRIAAEEGATFIRIGTALVGSESEAEK